MKHIGVMVLIGVTAASARVEAKGAAKSPPELIATFARGPASGLDGIRAFANAIQPGAGLAISDAMVDNALAQMAGLGSLAGLDATSPEYLLYLDDGAQKGLVLIAKVTDQTKLQLSGASTIATSNGWAAIGAPSLVKKVSSYALATLPAQPAPTMPSITVDVPHALVRYKSELAMVQKMTAGLAGKGDPMSNFMKIYADGLMGAAADTDRLVATIDADKTDVAIDFALVPKPGTRLAKFVAAQKTFDQALLAELPPASPAMLFAGHLESGPYRKAMVDLLTTMYGAGGGKEIAQFTDAVMAASTGDVAMTMDIVPGKGVSGAYVYGVADEKAVVKQLDKVHDFLAKARTFPMMGMKMTMVANADQADHDGVSVRGYDITYDLSGVPADQRVGMQAAMGGNLSTRYEMTSFDKLGLFAFGNDAVAIAGRAIDAARGKGDHWKPVGEVASALAASKARADSMVMVMDFGAFSALMPQTGAKKPIGQMVVTIGFTGGSAHFRMQMSAATIKSMKP